MAPRVEAKPRNLVKLFLDSGAYSAWTKNQPLDIGEYIKFCKANESSIWTAVNMDVIPGEFGRRHDFSQDEIERSAKQSYDNLKRIRDAGVNAIPVFHQGEPFEWLEKYLADGEKYIGMSAGKFLRVDEQMAWLDKAWTILTNKKGEPYVKIHGFALTSYDLMSNYPWYTVDSTTWSLTPGYGQIIIPAYVGGEPDYTRPPMRVAISGIMHQSVSSQKRQFENLGPRTQIAVVDYLERFVGTTITDVRYSTQERRRAMLCYYKHFCAAMRGTLFKGNRSSMIKPFPFKGTPLDPHNLIITFATSLNREWAMLMNEVESNHRLLSYWELQGKTPEYIAEYVQKGIVGQHKRAPIRQDFDSETYRNRRRLALRDLVQHYEEPNNHATFGPSGEA